MHTPILTSPVAGPLPVAALPVHPRRSGWRAGAAAALVDTAVADLGSGRSPAAAVLALADLGGYDLPRGLAGAEALDRRIASALAGVRALCLAADDVAAAHDVVDPVLAVLLDTLPAAAVAGCPHPGEWVASSVDVVPCAVHGYEAGPVDCLARSVRSFLLDATRPDGQGSRPGDVVTLAERVRSAPALAARSDPGVGHEPDVDTVLATLWLGVVTVAAWKAYAAAR